MAAMFWVEEIFWTLQRIDCWDTLWVKNFDEIALSCIVKEIEANLRFSPLWQKFENLKWPPLLERGKFLWKLPKVHCLDTIWVENFDKITLSRTVKEKIQNDRHFQEAENLWQN